MKHLNEAVKKIEEGKSREAFQILINVLELAPRNSEALHLQSLIYDSWGQFDKSLELVHRMAQLPTLEGEPLEYVKYLAQEEKEVLFFSRFSSQGRSYYSFLKGQSLFSILGLIGCLLFLWMLPDLMQEAKSLFIFFAGAVCIPWMSYFFSATQNIQKITIGARGLWISKAFSQKEFAWQKITQATLKYSENIHEDYLTLHLEFENQKTVTLDISRKHPVIRSRRHFLRSIHHYLPQLKYQSLENKEEIQKAA
jgi:hypothetical protein